MKGDPAAAMFLVMAQKDNRALQRMASDPEFEDEVFGFHAQQATEKAVKALLCAKNVAAGRTHDLETLFDQVSQQTELDMAPFNDLVELTDFAVQYRYQAFEELYVTVDRQKISYMVEKLIDFAAEVVQKCGAD